MQELVPVHATLEIHMFKIVRDFHSFITCQQIIIGTGKKPEVFY